MKNNIIKRFLKTFLLILLIQSPLLILGQKNVSLGEIEVIKEQLSSNLFKEFLSFDNAQHLSEKKYLPLYFEQLKLNSNEEVEVLLTILDRKPINKKQSEILLQSALDFNQQVQIFATYSYARKQKLADIHVLPFIKDGGSFYYVNAFTLDFKTKKVPKDARINSFNRSSGFKNTSVLREGIFYKLKVEEEGVYRISPGFINQIAGLENLSISGIRLFGNGGGMLPEQNWMARKDDLLEVPLEVFDLNNDGVFNGADYLLFYGQSPHPWVQLGPSMSNQYNRYEEATYYFLSLDNFNGAASRVATRVQPNNPPGLVLNTFLDHQFHEREMVNLISSGRNWYGEQLGIVNSLEFRFNFPNIDRNRAVRVSGRVAARSTLGNSTFSFRVGANSVSATVNSVPNSYESPFGSQSTAEMEYLPSGNLQRLFVEFQPPTSEARAWVDYLHVTAYRSLITTEGPLFFRNINIDDGSIVEYQLRSNFANPIIWNVSDQNDVYKVSPVINGDFLTFKYTQSQRIENFVIFDNNPSALKVPQSLGIIENQNLHALEGAEFVIVSHSLFMSQASQLADFHRNTDGLSVEVVDVQQIYNEFSSGAQDITAIKDFMRMLYQRGNQPGKSALKYLLLFGDASYDYKSSGSSNTNFVPTFQSPNSLSRTASYLSDDYFGLLDSLESSALSDKVDIGIGRFPVKSVEEARNMVNKNINYYDLKNRGPWRNFISFIADDEDRNIHMRDADSLSNRVEDRFPNYNIDKVYFDALPQITTPGGDRYRDVETAINNRVERGGLIVSYVGHGGVLGWAHERVLTIEHINRWENSRNLPLFVTATCEFTRFDDPKRTSAGELVFLNPDGGGIGLLTTTRLVYSTPNYILAREFNDIAYDRVDGETPTLGQLTMLTKQRATNDVNNRCFALIGNPALKLAYPQLRVIATEIPDSIRPLQKVTFKGYVADINNAKLGNYNGVLMPTVFDKVQEVQTLNNDGVGVFKFLSQNNIIFRGQASVNNGDWEFSFIAPKDISVLPGKGRVSFYTLDESTDGTGYAVDFTTGGIPSTEIQDKIPPEIDLFMNDFNFVNGGVTNNSPTLLAEFFDASGINTVGNGVGHDIVAVLNDDTQNPIVLNDFYQSAVDSFQRGSVQYQFRNLKAGPNKVQLTAWDVFNNPSTVELDFNVIESEDIVIENLLNYPNPFTTSTQFFFDHNQPSQNLDVRIQILSISGKLVKTIDYPSFSTGFRTGPIPWDGRDDFGDKIGRGVYIYHLKVRNAKGDVAEKFEKLVIL